jgi:hypothetical protein
MARDFDTVYISGDVRLGIQVIDDRRVKLSSPSLLQWSDETNWSTIEVVYPSANGENQTSRMGKEILTFLDFVDRFCNEDTDAPDGVKGGSWVYDAHLGGHGSKTCLSQTSAARSNSSIYFNEAVLRDAAAFLTE